jgi:hypothetical protein
MKKTFGGSRWKLRKLTSLSRFFPYALTIVHHEVHAKDVPVMRGEFNGHPA